MTDRNLPLVVLSVLFLVGSLSTGAVAQGTPNGVLLNQDTTEIGTVTVDDRTYRVYRQDNVVPWASGIAIYHDGDRVTSSSTAERVLTALAERRAIRELDREDVERLRAAERNASVAATRAASAVDAINDSHAYLERLRHERVDGRTAYNATIRAAPTVEEYRDSTEQLEPQLRSYTKDLGDFTENTTALLDLLEERRRNATAVDAHRIYDRYHATLEARNAVDEHLGIGGISDDLARTGSLSRTIAANASSVPEYGEPVERRFRRVNASASAAANATDTLELPGYEFEDARDEADALQSDWMDRWRNRRHPAADVYRTLGGLVIAAVVIAGYVGWRRR